VRICVWFLVRESLGQATFLGGFGDRNVLKVVRFRLCWGAWLLRPTGGFRLFDVWESEKVVDGRFSRLAGVLRDSTFLDRFRFFNL
jgi:hypothetical protein